MKTLKATVEISKIPWPDNVSKHMQAAYLQSVLESAGYYVTQVKCEEENEHDKPTNARGES